MEMSTEVKDSSSEMEDRIRLVTEALAGIGDVSQKSDAGMEEINESISGIDRLSRAISKEGTQAPAMFVVS